MKQICELSVTGFAFCLHASSPHQMLEFDSSDVDSGRSGSLLLLDRKSKLPIPFTSSHSINSTDSMFSRISPMPSISSTTSMSSLESIHSSVTQLDPLDFIPAISHPGVGIDDSIEGKTLFSSQNRKDARFQWNVVPTMPLLRVSFPVLSGLDKIKFMISDMNFLME